MCGHKYIVSKYHMHNVFQVNYMINAFGGVNIGEVVRLCLRNSMTDELMTHYNRTGRDGKRKLPNVLYLAIESEYFHGPNKTSNSVYSSI